MLRIFLENSLRTSLIEADQNKLSQVIRNFVHNAMKFTPEGGSISVKAFILVRSRRRHSISSRLNVHSDTFSSREVLRIQVIDSGRGIAAVSVQYIRSSVGGLDRWVQ